MDIIRVYFNGDDGKVKEFSFACSSWYHKPKIISAIAYALQISCNQEFLFATSTKYGCAQFPVSQSKSFPVHNLTFLFYKKGLPWLVAEFNDYADFKPFVKRQYFKFDHVLKCDFPDLCIDVLCPVRDGVSSPFDCSDADVYLDCIGFKSKDD